MRIARSRSPPWRSTIRKADRRLGRSIGRPGGERGVLSETLDDALFGSGRRLPIPGTRPPAAFGRTVMPCWKVMVMGGYGRSRMRGVIFGGITQSVPAAAGLPVFLLR
jgi:hypothetical protein